MILVLMRHGIAADLEPDEDRPLTPKGEKRVRQVAQVMEQFGLVPDVVLTSFRLRAIQTAQLVVRTLKQPLKPVRIPEIDILERWDDFARAVNAQAAELEDDAIILCVGHQTQIGCMATMAMHGQEFGMEIPKAGLMAFSFDGEVTAGAGRLDFALTPRWARSLIKSQE
jgi:phosphohistidine phosphatase